MTKRTHKVDTEPDSKPDNPALGLLVTTRERLRDLHDGLSTEDACVIRIRRLIAWSGRRP